MRKGAMLSRPVRGAIQREMADLVSQMGSQVNVAAALDVSPYAIGRAEKNAVVGPLIFEKLLKHLQLDEDGFFRRHGILEEVAALRAGMVAPPSSKVPTITTAAPTNHLAEALSVYQWDLRLKTSHRNNIVKQAIAGRERHDVDPPIEVWTTILRRLEALMLEITPDLEKMAAGGSEPLRDDAGALTPSPLPVRESLIIPAPTLPTDMLTAIRHGIEALVHEIAAGHSAAPATSLPAASPHNPVAPSRKRHATGPHRTPSASDTK